MGFHRIVVFPNNEEKAACETCATLACKMQHNVYAYPPKTSVGIKCELQYDCCEEKNQEKPHNIYYEIPGAGGGNDQYQTRQEAKKAFEDIVTSYPDCYCEWSYDGVGAHFTVEAYAGGQDD